MTEKLSVTIPEAARLCSVSRSTIYSEIGKGNLRVHRIGRRVTVTLENLKAWLSSKEAA